MLHFLNRVPPLVPQVQCLSFLCPLRWCQINGNAAEFQLFVSYLAPHLMFALNNNQRELTTFLLGHCPYSKILQKQILALLGV